jgi:cyclopropane fatty-acyl-phospholipid synthase-like methyltransferase
MEHFSHEQLLYGELTAHIRRMLEPVAHDSFLFFEDTARFLQEHIAPGTKVLDAGCGRGTIATWLAAQNCNVVAIDSSPDRMHLTQQLISEKHLSDKIHFELSKLPDAFPDDQFDAVVDCFSWWHISDWTRLLNLCRRGLHPRGKVIILDTFLGWKTTLDFRTQMREQWQTALPTFNECKNMLIKRDFRLLKSDSIQDPYIRYLKAINEKIHELEREDLGTFDARELEEAKKMWQWFLDAAVAEDLSATLFVAELTES